MTKNVKLIQSNLTKIKKRNKPSKFKASFMRLSFVIKLNKKFFIRLIISF